ncbi:MULTISPECIES: cupin domain-containing protein [Micrococcaceae]|uniref:cupin domain-containing protein n=1 Tax=Micrococcaceae TaxID=1268 RepID=UPI00345F2654
MPDPTPANSAGLHVPAGDGHAVWLNGDLYTSKLDSRDTQGRITVLEATVPPGGGPPRHNHLNEDEIFYVIDGRLEITIGDTEYEAGPGSLVFVPQGAMHSFTNRTRDYAKQLLLFTPGGFERFFFEAGLTAEAGRPIPELAATDQHLAQEIAAKYGSIQEGTI